jgi:eukaryotic-like serine/threonine-protein kinase
MAAQNHDGNTVDKADASPPSADATERLPERIGRYRVIRPLGQGGFGKVYLASDEYLDRLVAIKVPNPERIIRPEDVEAYLAEARILASLKHPHIVPVFDFGRTDDGSCYVVSEYVEGSDLKARIRNDRPGYRESAELVATIALALHYAHLKGVFHRDVKPANVLIDKAGRPILADFGLALKDEDLGFGAKYAGTPAYMSPEQARGEGHLVDGRSDIFSLGMLFYELLAGQLAFRGNTEQLLDQILHVEVRPPRQIDEKIPKELERICLKALSRRATERYPVAGDMAEDLRHFLNETPPQEDYCAVPSPGGAPGRQPRPALKGEPDLVGLIRSDSDRVLTTVVPKGLRSFDAHDADFFLELLPGPRNREGLPESIRFWKTRIEETDADNTFRVGLIYGPSGCGKSSLVKAGLLPRLSVDVLTVYVESTADETEARLLRGLRKRCPNLAPNLALVNSLAAIRRGKVLPGPKKLLLILDQFEQWLHARRGAEDTQLVAAMRQCDGEHVQALVMVRDDFWSAATRFMKELEMNPVPDQNIAFVDLFDLQHARRVLGAFGAAYGKLPERERERTRDHQAFLDQAINELSQDGKVISVRLALFAEMVKGKPWNPSTLKESGGTEGIGVRFLEEMISERSVNPRYRDFERPARKVLKSLLPGVGCDIKAQTRSYAELLAASELQDRHNSFAELLRFLDTELRLITPIDDPETTGPPDTDRSLSRWQLTHDYLVPTLRAWLTRKQGESLRGRTELRLEDHATLWAARPEARFLPSFLEWVAIRSLTKSKGWTVEQRKMIRNADRRQGTRLACAGLILVACISGIWAVRANSERVRREHRTNELVNQLLVADLGELAGIITTIEHEALPVGSRLTAVAVNSAIARETRFRANYGLAGRPGPGATGLIEEALLSGPREVAVIRDRIAPYAAALRAEIWARAGRAGLSPAEQLRLAALLAVGDPDGPRWRELARPITDALLATSMLDLPPWIDLLEPVASTLTPVLCERFSDAKASSSERVSAAVVLAQYAGHGLFTQLLLDADAAQFVVLSQAAPRHRTDVVDAARLALKKQAGAGGAEIRLSPDLRARNAAMALFRLGETEDLEPLLGISADPSVRTNVILEVRNFGITPEQLLDVVGRWSDPTARQALLLAFAGYQAREVQPGTWENVIDQLAVLVRKGRHQCERSAAEWLLRHWGCEADLATWSQKLPDRPPAQPRVGAWWVAPSGHTMVIVGHLPSAGGRSEAQGAPATGSPAKGERWFALSVQEVSFKQYRQFRPDAIFPWAPGNERWPATMVSFLDAMSYCRWLSEQEKVPVEQMCYPALDQIAEADTVPSDERMSRIGYRLPSEEEWELAARAGSITEWFGGSSESQVTEFAWSAANSGNRLQPVGILRPNQLGFFDILGNAFEWCHRAANRPATDRCVGRGGWFREPPAFMSSTTGHAYPHADVKFSFTGFRLARSLAIAP